MRFRKSAPPKSPDESTDAAHVGTETATDPASALTVAEAEAEAAEAAAAAARSRADEIRLRPQSMPDEGGTDTEIVDETAQDAVTDEAPEDTIEDSDGPQLAASAPKPRRRFGPVLRWAAATLSVLLIGALATVSVLMVIAHRKVEADQRWAAEYAAAARQSVVTLMSLDFNSVDEDVKRIIENSTGDFRKEFESQAKDFATVARESKVVTEARATAAAVESMTEKDAVVLVTASSTVTNTSGAQQEPRSWRLTVNLTREGDQIKMSKVEFAP